MALHIFEITRSYLLQGLCVRMQDDIDAKKKLDVRYPGAILTVRYEDFVTEPRLIVDRVFEHVGRPAPANIDSFIRRTMHQRSKRPTGGEGVKHSAGSGGVNSAAEDGGVNSIAGGGGVNPAAGGAGVKTTDGAAAIGSLENVGQNIRSNFSSSSATVLNKWRRKASASQAATMSRYCATVLREFRYEI